MLLWVTGGGRWQAVSNDVEDGGGGNGFEWPQMPMDDKLAVVALLMGWLVGGELFWGVEYLVTPSFLPLKGASWIRSLCT